jgi:hypothetical protein
VTPEPVREPLLGLPEPWVVQAVQAVQAVLVPEPLEPPGVPRVQPLRAVPAEMAVAEQEP